MNTPALSDHKHGVSALEQEAAHRAITLAIATVMERIARLPVEDRDDLFRCFEDLIECKSAAEFREIEKTMMEILSPDRGVSAVRAFDGENPSSRPKEYSEWVKFISTRIRELRSKREMSQDQLAQASGLPQSHVSRLENGKHSPSYATLTKLAKAFGVKIWELDPNAPHDGETDAAA